MTAVSGMTTNQTGRKIRVFNPQKPDSLVMAGHESCSNLLKISLNQILSLLLS